MKKPERWKAPPELVQAAFAAVRALARRSFSGEDAFAIDLAVAALSYVTGDASYGDGRTKAAEASLRRAHDVLVGGHKAAERDALLANIDRAVEMGPAFGWTTMAGALAEEHGQPASVVPELARRLQRHRIVTKPGKAPADTYSTRAIAEWMTGDHEVAKHASRRRRMPRGKGRP